MTAGQASDVACFAPALDGVRVCRRRGRPRKRPKYLVADKAYSLRPVRQWARRYGVRAVLPRRKDHRRRGRPAHFDPALYRSRNRIERAIGRLKERRRLSTRHEKLASNFTAMLHVAFLLSYLRQLDSSDRA